jgi:hypothetical protein
MALSLPATEYTGALGRETDGTSQWPIFIRIHKICVPLLCVKHRILPGFEVVAEKNT